MVQYTAGLEPCGGGGGGGSVHSRAGNVWW